MKNEVTYKISDTNNGTKAVVTLPEGTFNLTLNYHKGMNNQRVWTVDGNYPKDKWLISYEGGKLFILKKGGEYEVGQEINHKAFGKGIITNINDNMLSINFDKVGEKIMMKSILKNFIK
jgi:hypothetical protein